MVKDPALGALTRSRGGTPPAGGAAGGARAFLAAHAAKLLGTAVGPVPDVAPSS